MKNWKKVRGILAAAALLAALHTTAAFADTTVSITGGDNLQVGSPVAVTVTLQNETSMDESDLFVTYDSTLLQFVSGDGAEAESDGRIRIRGDYTEPVMQQIWTLQFTALAEGSASVGAEDVWVKDTDGDTDADVTVNAGIVNIAQASDAQATAAATEQAATAATEQTTDDTLTALEQEIANDGTMSCLIGTEKWIVAESFGTDILWNHFVMATQFYKGVEVAAGKLNNAEYYVLLVRSEDGSQEKFVHYDESTKTFSEVACLQLDTDSAVYMTDPAEEDIPSYFTETEYNGYRVWQITEDIAVSEYGADVTEFYMIYGYNENGAGGWLLWDTVANSAVRYVEMTPTSQQSSAVTTDTSDATLATRYDNLLSRFDFMVTCIKYVAIALIALLLILLVVNLSDKGSGDEKKEKKDKKKEKKEEKKSAASDTGASKPVTEKPKTVADSDAEKQPPKTAAVSGDKKTAPKPAAVSGDKKAAPKPAAVSDGKKTASKPAAVSDAKKKASEPVDDFIDDYVEDPDDLAAPQNEAEEAAIGVLKPKDAAVSDAEKTASKPAEATEKSAKKSVQDSLEGLSQKLKESMGEEEKTEPEEEELTFIDLGDE